MHTLKGACHALETAEVRFHSVETAEVRFHSMEIAEVRFHSMETAEVRFHSDVFSMAQHVHIHVYLLADSPMVCVVQGHLLHMNLVLVAHTCLLVVAKDLLTYARLHNSHLLPSHHTLIEPPVVHRYVYAHVHMS